MFPLFNGFLIAIGVRMDRKQITCASTAAGADAVSAITGALVSDLSPPRSWKAFLKLGPLQAKNGSFKLISS